MSTTFDAGTFAQAWLSVSIASGKDADRPQLDRTVSIELYPEGARLIATDSYMLLTHWVPAINRYDDPQPGLDEKPVATAVAMDTNGRARSLMGHMLGLARAQDEGDPEDIVIRMSLGVIEADDDAVLAFDGFEIPWVILEHPDRERLKLRTYEGSYPEWRSLLGGFTSATTRAIALNGEMMARLAKVAKYEGAPIEWRFGGPDRAAYVVIGDTAGVVMPTRLPIELEDDAAA